MINPRIITLCWRKRQKAYLYAAKILNFVRKQAESIFFSDSAVLRAFPCMILQQLFHGKEEE